MNEEMKAVLATRILAEIADKGVPDHTNIWPAISSRLSKRRRGASWTRGVLTERLVWTALVLVAFLVLASAAYAAGPIVGRILGLTPPESGFAVPHPTDFEDILSGDTLAMYQDLPPEFQQALQAYAAWGIAYDLVPIAVDQKMRQWPANPAPMSDILSPVGYQKFQELDPVSYKQALYLLYFYPYVLSTEEDPDAQQRALERMVAAIHEGEPDDPFEPPLPQNPDAYKYPNRDPSEPLNFHDILTGDTPSRYQNLPPEYRQALWDYAQTIDGSEQIPVAIERVVLNLPENPESLVDVLSLDTYEKFQELDTSVQVTYLLDWYPKVLKEQENPDTRKRTLEQLAIAMYEEKHAVPVRLPSIEKVLLPEAIRKLDSVGPNLQRSFGDFLVEVKHRYDMLLLVWINDWEMLLLKATKDLELPPLEDMLSEETLQQFQSLSLGDQRHVRNSYASSVVFCIGPSQDPNDTICLDNLEVVGRGKLESSESFIQMFSSHKNELYDVWGNSDTDVFAVGDSGAILHYDGSNWTSMTSGTLEILYGIWGDSGSDMFAVGDSGTILHYDGSTWSSMTGDSSEFLLAAWGTSGSDVVVVGDSGTILHYDGSTWRSTSSGVSNALFGVWGDGTDVFAVGASGAIVYYNGAYWSQMRSGVRDALNGVWGSYLSDVFVVGRAGTILHYDGSTWSSMPSAPYNLKGVWGSSGSDVFAVGGSGLVYHYDDSAWSPMASPINIGQSSDGEPPTPRP